MTLIRVINSILEVGHKTTTLKYATLLAMFDYIIDHPNEKPLNNFHLIPIIYLAKQFLSYYYPLSFTDINQGNLQEGKQLAVFNYIKSDLKENDKLKDATLKKAILSKEEGIIWINQLFDLPEPLPDELIGLLWKIRRKTLEQPLKFIHNVDKETVRFFGLVNHDVAFNSDYDAHLKAGIGQKAPESGLNWLEMMEFDTTSIILDDITYKELTRYRFWIRDVISKKWYEFCVKNDSDKSRKSAEYLDFFEKLNLAYLTELARDSYLMTKYREFFDSVDPLRCVISGQLIIGSDDYHVDHLLPWSFYRVNRFWNLFPVQKDINLEKSNLLPELTDGLKERLRIHLEKCLSLLDAPGTEYIANVINDDLKYFYWRYLKNKDVDLKKVDKGEIVKNLLISIEKDWQSLYESIPRKLYKLDKNISQ